MLFEPSDSNSSTAALKKALVSLRIIWFGMLLGEMLFAGVVFFQLQNRAHTTQPLMGQLLFFIDVIMLAVALPVGWLIRHGLTKADAQGLTTFGRYSTGTIIFLALCEGPAFFGFVSVVIGGKPWPNLLVPAIAVLAQLVSFPTGRGVRI